jgi:hypothetical protein
LAVSEKLPATVRAIVVCEVKMPLVPLIVSVDVPVAAAGLAVRVSVEEVDEDVGLKDAVTPLGSPLMLKATFPVNAPFSMIVIVEVALVL